MDAACLSRLLDQVSREVNAREAMRQRLGFAAGLVPERWQENDIQRHLMIAWGVCLRSNGCPVRIASQSLRLLAPESELPMVHHEEMYFLIQDQVPFGVGASGMDALLAQFKQTFFPHEALDFQLGPQEDCTQVLASSGLGRWGELFTPAFCRAMAALQSQRLQSATVCVEEEGVLRRL